MKNAAQIMYKIGRIINIVLIPLSALILVIGIILFATTNKLNPTSEELATIATATSSIFWGIFFINYINLINYYLSKEATRN